MHVVESLHTMGCIQCKIGSSQNNDKLQCKPACILILIPWISVSVDMEYTILSASPSPAC